MYRLVGIYQTVVMCSMSDLGSEPGPFCSLFLHMLAHCAGLREGEESPRLAHQENNLECNGGENIHVIKGTSEIIFEAWEVRY